jgi:ABC-type uncharacterized transport system ATPase subunit
MAYSKAKLKSSGNKKHLYVWDHSGQENYDLNVYLYKFYCDSFKHNLNSLTSFMGILNSMLIMN